MRNKSLISLIAALSLVLFGPVDPVLLRTLAFEADVPLELGGLVFVDGAGRGLRLDSHRLQLLDDLLGGETEFAGEFVDAGFGHEAFIDLFLDG